jgi:NAD(P)-dependent dehydrogenase (short-subunit alcohol dehydrogenase family)
MTFSGSSLPQVLPEDAAEPPDPAIRVARLDLADLASVREFAASWLGTLHVLVNNAGAGGREGGCADG